MGQILFFSVILALKFTTKLNNCLAKMIAGTNFFHRVIPSVKLAKMISRFLAKNDDFVVKQEA